MDDGQVINVAGQPERMIEVRALFREYAADMGQNLNFQGFEQELADLPGCYALPMGGILFAEVDATLAGCIALRPIGEGTGEVKRLFVRPEYRRRGLARRLADEIINLGFECGYRRLLLDTLGTMTAARKLYESLGFKLTDPYYHNPLPDVVYYELDYHEAARNYVAKHARKLGSGRWGVTLQNDNQTTMEEVVLLIQEFCLYDLNLAHSLMRICHLHGSVIIKRCDTQEQAEDLIVRMNVTCLRRDVPLSIVIYRIPDHLMV